MGLLKEAVNSIRRLFGKTTVRAMSFRVNKAEYTFHPKLQHRKGKSQKRNWRHWKGKQ